MENILVVPKNEKQLNLVKAMLDEMKIEYRSGKSKEAIFFPELEKRVKEARKEKQRGELLTIDPRKVWENI